MIPFGIDPLEAAVFACGFVLAVLLVRTLKARHASRVARPTAGRGWMPAAIAFALLLALWFYLS